MTRPPASLERPARLSLASAGTPRARVGVHRVPAPRKQLGHKQSSAIQFCAVSDLPEELSCCLFWLEAARVESDR